MAQKQSVVSRIEKDVKNEESKLKDELVKEKKGIEWFLKSHTFRLILVIALFVALISGIIYLTISHGRIYIDKSEINAPLISLSPASPGILEKVFVREGDVVAVDTTVAQVNGNAIKTKTAGVIVSVDNSPGAFVSSASPVVQMIDPQQLRVIGHIQEDKGLSDIKVGQKVIFTVDAFGSKQYTGSVESIGQLPRQSAIAFSISDKREEKEFDVTVRFDSYSYPELKSGMSAKMWIYK